MGIANYVVNNYLLDWNTVPNIDFGKPWWNIQSNETLSINKKVFLTVSDLIIPEPNVIFFNKSIVKDYELEDPYKVARDGKWTYDKIYEIAKGAAKDIDGNGIWDDKDQYGYVTQLDWNYHSVPNSAGIKLADKDSNGRFVLTDQIEKLHSVLESVNNLANDPTVTFAYSPGILSGGRYISPLPLSTGRALFHSDPLPEAYRYRELDFDYGILPWPKYEEAQAKYQHFSHNGFIVVLQTASQNDLEKIGIITEALSAESYKYCVSAYKEVLLGEKLTRDADSVEMLDLIYDTMVFDIGRTYLVGDPIQEACVNLLKKKSTDFASVYEKSAEVTQKKLDELYDKVLEHV
jgi:hypothetical protein